jgi:hypothetical protein
MDLPRKRWRRIAPEVRANCKARVPRMSHRVARTRARSARSGFCVRRDTGRGCRCAHLAYECTQARRSRTCECMPIPVPITSLILLASCPTRERFLEAIPKSDRAKAGRTGAPRNGRRTGGQGGAPGGAAPYVTGRARLALSAARDEAVLVSRVPRKHPGASRRSIPSRGSRGILQTSDALRRENAEAWVFEIFESEFEARRRNILRVIRGLDPPIHRSSKRLLRRGWIAGSSPAMTS